MAKSRAPEPWRNQIVRYGDEAPDQLLAHPLNPKIHPKQQQDALAGALGEVGWIAPVIVNETTGHVIDGHARIGLAISRGEPSVPVAYVQLTEEAERLALATFDPIGALAGMDDENLARLLDGLTSADEAVSNLLRDLAPPKPKNLNSDDADLTPPAEPITKPGDLWIMGEHRLLCGDATKAEDAARLMDGRKAGVMFTDPPYGIGLDMENDDLKGVSLDQFNQSWCAVAWNVTGRDAPVVIFNSTRTFPSVLDAARGEGFEFLRMLTIYKPNDMTFPWHGWLLTSEAILLMQKGKASFIEVHPYAHDCYSQNHTAETLADDVGGHPAAKQMPVVRDLLGRIEGSLILDLFGGTGSTLIAAERSGRTAYLMEIEPAYCDVIVRRWEQVSGRQAVKENA